MGYSKRTNKARASTKKRITFIVLITIVCSLVLSYPIVSTLNNNKHLADAVDLYSKDMDNTPTAVKNKMLEDAHRYNDELSRRPITPPPIGKDKQDPRYAEYDKQLRTGVEHMATLVIPDQDISLPIYHGTSDEVLYKGAGHMFGTHLPVGGESTTSAIAAHTGMATASMFDNVRFMKDGQLAFIHVAGETLTYKKVSHKIVPANSTDSIEVQKGRDLLQLITCTPYGVNSERLVVTLERTANPEPFPEEANNSGNSIFHWAWWMTLITGLEFLLLMVSFHMIRRELTWYDNTMKKRRERAKLSIGENTVGAVYHDPDADKAKVDRKEFYLLGKRKKSGDDSSSTGVVKKSPWFLIGKKRKNNDEDQN